MPQQLIRELELAAKTHRSGIKWGKIGSGQLGKRNTHRMRIPIYLYMLCTSRGVVTEWSKEIINLDIKDSADKNCSHKHVK